MYHKLKDKPGVWCDVDDTLVMWPGAGKFQVDETNIDQCLKLECGPNNFVYCMPNKEHIEALKQHKARGHIICVWSQGGADWAEEVVKALKLQDVVDLVCSKPNWLIDDLPVSVWLPENIRYYKNGY